MHKLLTILPWLFMMFQPLNAKVEKPNYDFSLDALNDFYPQKELADLNNKHGKGELVNSVSGMKTYKYQLSHIRYKFPVMVQEKDGKVYDFFARLPSYFLHDVFFQSLINRMGKQTSFKKFGEEAVYTWEKDSLKHIYSAACTITCFPIFYAVEPIPASSATLLKQMKKTSSGK